MQPCLINFDIDETTAEHDNRGLAMINQLQTAIATNPQILDNYFKLKSLYSAYTRESLKAFKVLETALTYFPDNVRLLVELATLCEFELEDYAQARQYYERILTLNHNHELALAALDVLNDPNLLPN